MFTKLRSLLGTRTKQRLDVITACRTTHSGCRGFLCVHQTVTALLGAHFITCMCLNNALMSSMPAGKAAGALHLNQAARTRACCTHGNAVMSSSLHGDTQKVWRHNIGGTCILPTWEGGVTTR
jgi:hypothetical protein